MSHTINNRRRFLQQALLGAAATAFPGLLLAREGYGNFKSSPTPSFNPDVEIEFTAQPAQIAIFNDGPATMVQKFFATLRKGPSNTLTTLPNNYLGPILTLQQGQKVRVFFNNKLNESTIIHWHGLHVPQTSDGHPMYSIAPGEQFVYEFEVLNRAGSSFYHSHAHELTAQQVYRGLAGLIIVNDQDESRLDLPRGEYDLPLVIQDRSFNQQNQLQYSNSMRDRMMGFLGDTVLVNGKPKAEFTVKSRAYRFRALNGSNSRIYKLGWSDGSPLVAIGTDGGLLPKPESRAYIMLAPGERVDLWLDFSDHAVGSRKVLLSLPFSGALPGMHENAGGGGMGMMHHGISQGSRLTLASFLVHEKVSDSPKLPEKLVPFKKLSISDTDNPDNPLPIAISMQAMQPLLNGKSFAMDKVMDFERVALGSIKRINIFHDQGHQPSHGSGMGMKGGMGMMGSNMMEMAHPIHLHGQQYQVLSRKGVKANPEDYATVKDGFIDTGWKDTVLVMPGESVEIIKPFQDYKGLFLYHCHNLEHENMGMMRQFYVG